MLYHSRTPEVRLQRRFPTVLALLLVLLPAVAGAAPLRLTAGVAPLSWLVRAVAGERAEVRTLLPDRACETWSPGAEDIRRAVDSELVFLLGAEYERPWREALLRAKPNLRLVDLAEGVAELGGPDGTDIRARGLFGVWLAPARARELARNAAKALRAADPAGAGTYDRNLAALEERLDGLDARLAELFASAGTRRLFVSGRPDWAWLAAAYGLEELAVAGFGEEPNAAWQRKVWLTARQRGVAQVLDRPRCGSKAARALALTLKAQVFPADPLDGDYENNLLRVARRIRAAPR